MGLAHGDSSRRQHVDDIHDRLPPAPHRRIPLRVPLQRPDPTNRLLLAGQPGDHPRSRPRNPLSQPRPDRKHPVFLPNLVCRHLQSQRRAGYPRQPAIQHREVHRPTVTTDWAIAPAQCHHRFALVSVRYFESHGTNAATRGSRALHNCFPSRPDTDPPPHAARSWRRPAPRTWAVSPGNDQRTLTSPARLMAPAPSRQAGA